MLAENLCKQQLYYAGFTGRKQAREMELYLEMKYLQSKLAWSACRESKRT